MSEQPQQDAIQPAQPQQPQLSVETMMNRLGRCAAEQSGFINCPIYRGSTNLFDNFAASTMKGAEFRYGTFGNPTRANLEKAWTALTGGAGTLALSSGAQAVAYALMAVLNAGDNVLMTDTAYLPTRKFCDGFLSKKGISTVYYDPCITPEDLRELLRKYPNTTALFMESPGSQTFEVQDVPGLCAVAHEFNVATLIDNTWATPLFFDAHAKGCDISIEAGTKYLSGHSDLIMGLISANATWFPTIKETLMLFQSTPGDESCFLALRGLRTMYLRVREAERRGLEMARFMESRPEVLKVLHPAMSDCPGHEIWKRDFTGSTAVFSVILLPKYTLKDVEHMLDSYKIFQMGFSWGGFESLVMYYDCTSYRTATAFAPGGLLVRYQIGLENMEDLKDDLSQGFDHLRSE
ncbi:cystathionine beta-lyase putative (CD) [Leptomonas pyrrhocoris]|uniref:Cystathionine beta-lyase putative (CD) n=1 Tax=Leptomonas pyrrhocoris TaxID=157538 RepID=A0A0M9G8T7_LEPPY|nr:cystathionine beta-lyase putative (CD) [Leptomonas pyrrhocoris]KPA84866.1 cystathionine beta-lyase putative (CD) [Leptomonas pyrrhocoris]|eukprot:XP_015663305.1 cystathionine beta-lyase putative (CD) [Leptomonas pyrrhocoris]